MTMKRKIKKKKKSILEQTEIDLSTIQGRLFLFFIIIVIVLIFIFISQNTSSFYDWYPGKGIDDMRRNGWQNK
jgi:uncharacterized integral membrane protein